MTSISCAAPGDLRGLRPLHGPQSPRASLRRRGAERHRGTRIEVPRTAKRQSALGRCRLRLVCCEHGECAALRLAIHRTQRRWTSLRGRRDARSRGATRSERELTWNRCRVRPQANAPPCGAFGSVVSETNGTWGHAMRVPGTGNGVAYAEVAADRVCRGRRVLGRRHLSPATALDAFVLSEANGTRAIGDRGLPGLADAQRRRLRRRPRVTRCPVSQPANGRCWRLLTRVQHDHPQGFGVSETATGSCGHGDQAAWPPGASRQSEPGLRQHAAAGECDMPARVYGHGACTCQLVATRDDRAPGARCARFGPGSDVRLVCRGRRMRRRQATDRLVNEKTVPTGGSSWSDPRSPASLAQQRHAPCHHGGRGPGHRASRSAG